MRTSDLLNNTNAVISDGIDRHHKNNLPTYTDTQSRDVTQFSLKLCQRLNTSQPLVQARSRDHVACTVGRRSSGEWNRGGTRFWPSTGICEMRGMEGGQSPLYSTHLNWKRCMSHIWSILDIQRNIKNEWNGGGTVPPSIPLSTRPTTYCTAVVRRPCLYHDTPRG